MVGLVLVAHSRALAEALAGLVRQVVSADLRLAVAAGAGPDGQEFGTDAGEVARAVQAVYSPEGVLVLVDLGSAVLSAEMALDFLPKEMSSRVAICSGPLVEGAIAAGVQASLGSDLQTVCQEAQKALSPKIEHLSGSLQAGGQAPSAPVWQAPGGPLSTVTLTLGNPHGLHARPAARFVQASAAYDAEVWVMDETSNKGPASARSLNSLATLGAREGHQITITARGMQAAEALEALRRLVEAHFGEPLQPTRAVEAKSVEPIRAVEVAGAPIEGVPVSEGVAIGPLFLYQPPPPPVQDKPAADPQAEWGRLQAAIDKASRVIQERGLKVRLQLGEAEAGIFDAHLLILQDEDLLREVRKRIYQDHQNAGYAWKTSVEEVANRYRALEDPYQRTRAADVVDVGDQVLFALAERSEAGAIPLSAAAIVYAAALTPGEIAQLDPALVLGLVTFASGQTSHSAILIRSLGLPCLSGIDLTALGVQSGAQVGFDGSAGLLWVNPPGEVQAELARRRQGWLEERARLVRTSHVPATLRDGRRIEVAANAGSLVDARAASLNGADGIGVLRTEFLYLNRLKPPGEEEQLSTLREIFRAMAGQPVIVRTLDIGGDKPLPYVHMPAEANPFLGMRAIRLSLRRPDLFLTQVRAVLRAGADSPVRLMYPMIASLDEIAQARAYLEQAHRELEGEGIPHLWPIQAGIMVEIPSAALLSAKLAPLVDFFSIGTNDLTQYTLAAERGNPELVGYLDALHPAVLRLVKMVTEAAEPYGKWVGVCGEVAGDLAAVPILVGLGVTELSMNPTEIPRVKELLRSIDPEAARSLAEKALDCSTAQEVRARAAEASRTT